MKVMKTYGEVGKTLEKARIFGLEGEEMIPA